MKTGLPLQLPNKEECIGSFIQHNITKTSYFTLITSSGSRVILAPLLPEAFQIFWIGLTLLSIQSFHYLSSCCEGPHLMRMSWMSWINLKGFLKCSLGTWSRPETLNTRVKERVGYHRSHNTKLMLSCIFFLFQKAESSSLREINMSMCHYQTPVTTMIHHHF